MSNCAQPRAICTPEHPGYIGTLPPDPSDAAAVNLISQVPYIGAAAAALLGPNMLKGGPVCVEDERKNVKSDWSNELIAAAIFAGSIITLFVISVLRK